MKIFFSVAIILFCFRGHTQKTISEFPGTGFGLILPDTSFHYGDRGFSSSKYKASIQLINQEADFSNYRFDKIVDQMLQELKRPGTTILSDEYLFPDSNRIIKTLIEYDITDAHPATKGRKGIGWLYFYKYNQHPVLLLSSYDYERDSELSALISTSIKTFTVIRKPKLFKNSFTITEDYQPLKFCGESSGGIRLNMEGKYQITGIDPSYCLIVPMNISMPVAKPDSMRDYMLKRMQIHENSDAFQEEWSIHVAAENTIYEMVAKGKEKKAIYFAIKKDEQGYFEIWGEAFRNSGQLVQAFKKITQSIKRE